jgi:ribonuclease HI
MTIRAAADGSALGNPGPAGWAWYVDDSCWAAGGWKHATNNQAELTAVLQFFRATAHLPDDLLILCDSQYVINCVTKWMPGWKKKGWRKADGKPVMNVELLQEIDAELPGRNYRFEWVKGHANHPLNEAADSRARAVSEAYQRGASIPSGPGFTGAERPAPTEEPAQQATHDSSAPLFDLFDLAEPPTDIELTVRLTTDEFARLQSRARTRGIAPEELLRALI